MDSKKRYYVYEWYNKDSGDVFYVGKGTRNRWKNTSSRNNYFKNYFSKYNCDVRKVKENLSESDAFVHEILLIDKYKKDGQCKCNITTGGEGATLEYGTKEYYFRKIQYMYNCTSQIDMVSHRGNYSKESLRGMDIEEIKELYGHMITSLDSIKTEKEFEINYFQNITSYDVLRKNKELSILIDSLGIKTFFLDEDAVNIFVCHIRDILYGIKTFILPMFNERLKLKSFDLKLEDYYIDSYFSLELQAPKLKHIDVSFLDIFLYTQSGISALDFLCEKIVGQMEVLDEAK